MKSLRADANLRSPLTDNCANYRRPTGLADLEFSDQCFMDEFAITLRLIKSGEFQLAASFLDRSRNKGI